MQCIFSNNNRCCQSRQFNVYNTICDGEDDKEKCPFWFNAQK